MSLTNDETFELSYLEARCRDLMSREWLSAAERQDYDQASFRMSDLQRRAESSPIQHFTDAGRTGPLAPPAGFPQDPSLSVPAPLTPTLPPPAAPGPPSNLDAEGNPGLINPPTQGQTQFLPLTGLPKFDQPITILDRALASTNDKLFNLNPRDVSDYEAASLGGAGGPTQLASLGDTANALGDYTTAMSGEFNALKSTMGNADPSDTVLARAVEAYRAPLESALAVSGAGSPAERAQDAVAQCGNGVNENFTNFRNVIRSARESIAGLYTRNLVGQFEPDESKNLVLPSPTGVEEAGQASAAKLDAAEKALRDSTGDWEIPIRSTTAFGAVRTPQDNSPVTEASLAATEIPDLGLGSETEGGTPAVGGSPSGEGNSAFLVGNQPGQPMVMMPGQMMPGQMMPGQMMPVMMPQQPTTGGLPQFGIPQIPDPTAPFAPLISDAFQATQLASDRAADEQASAIKQAQAAQEQQRERATTDAGNAATNAVMSNVVSRPGEAVRPGALGADGLPLDKDGDGKMDADAVALTKENLDRDGDGKPDPVTATVSADGREIPVTVSDPRLVEIINRMSEGTSGDPVRVLDAIQESGIAASDYGTKIDTMELKPGDVVTGSGKGVYLGDGLVLTEKGDVKGLPEVMDFRNSSQTPAAYRIDLPELPTNAQAADAASGTQQVSAASTDPEPVPEPRVETAAVPVTEPEPVPVQSEPALDQAAAEPVPAAAPSPAEIPVSSAPPLPPEPVTITASSSNGTYSDLPSATVPSVPAPTEPAPSEPAPADAEPGVPAEVPYQGRPLG
jgi:hypothetical protein